MAKRKRQQLKKIKGSPTNGVRLDEVERIERRRRSPEGAVGITWKI